MSECKAASAQLELGNAMRNVNETNDAYFDSRLYHQAIGCLLFLPGGTRPDIANAVCKLSQHCETPTKGDWKRVKHVFRYLKGTKDYALNFSRTGKHIEVFADADWANDRADAKSISGYVVKLAGAAVIWRSRKQGCVATSTTHAEYIAMYEALTEVMWLKAFLQETELSVFFYAVCYQCGQ
ncbi:secreted RxLR effector protein 161-like [Ischnura elegans]|uniref:secreted RxLR effector protein 161-like n=1 Tax=Ischnura elegans TaxID=197161 RepID=UPI001ED886F2|nr:secreted RxLR effector protein 161-like [Ischnura elegans]